MLRKVGKSLRDEGTVLIFQPAIENRIVEVEVNGKVVFRQETIEQNFRDYLHATVEAIHQTVNEGIFEFVHETVIPNGNSYDIKEYESLDKWEEDRLAYCEDLEELSKMSEEMQELVQSRKHKILEYRKEYKVLLRNRR